MTSELRPAVQVEVTDADRELFVKLTGYDSNSIDAILGGSAFTWEVEQIARHRIAEREAGYQAAVREIAAYLKKHNGYGAGWYGADVEHKFGERND